MNADRRPTVLLLHGQPGGKEDWKHVLEALGDRGELLAIDRPGWDGRTPPSDLAGNCRAALDALDRADAERATVVGHSFGGAVACWLAAEHPDRVDRLVLAAPAANRAALYRIDRWLAAPLLGEIAGAAALSGIGLALTAGPVRERLGRELGLEQSYLRVVGRRLLSPAVWSAFTADQRTLVRDLPALDDRLSAITAPTVILAGRRDRVVPLSALSELATQIPGARLVLVEHADHLLPLRQAGAFAEIILDEATVAG